MIYPRSKVVDFEEKR